MDEFGAVYFCGTSECLQDDCKASLALKNEVEKTKPKQDACDLFGIGSRYRNASLTKWMATNDQKKQVADWLSNPRNMLVLSGDPGVGKTYFCVALANRFIEKEKEVHYINAHRFIELVGKCISNDKSQYDAINTVAKRPILILDDFGTASSSEWAKEVFFDLIDQRYNSKHPTIITTNLNSYDMKQQFNERTERRVFAPENLKITIKKEELQ